MRYALLAIALAVGLSGCAANAFEKHYSPRPGSDAVVADPAYEHPAGDAHIYASTGDAATDSLRAQEQGYEYLGSSAFYGSAQALDPQQIIDQARKVGASMVLVQSKYKNTLSELVPSGTTYTSGGIGAIDTSKYSTIPRPEGSTGTKGSFSVPQYDIVATFWIHRDISKVPFGVVAGPLPVEVRTRLQGTAGVVVVVVMRGTPAYAAKIYKDDVIVRIHGEEVIDPASFERQVARFSGQEVDVDLLRGSSPRTVTVTLR